MIRALVVDDDAGVRYTLRGTLEDEGILVDEAGDGDQALALLASNAYDLVVSDLRMPRLDGIELLRRLPATPRRPTFILITAHGSERHAVEAMKLGAYDYFKKPFDPDDVVATVRRAVDAARLRADNARLTGELHLARSLLFASPAMGNVAELVQRVAPKDVTVLVTGESGTGKERVADAIVRASRRHGRPFVRLNCAALSPELAEAELFGHAKGAFTGAHRTRRGVFREADGGTVLLDEVGELDLAVQAKLLRVLQDGEVRPVGEDKPAKVDVRVIAATHRDLARRVEDGLFREDLRYRLNVVAIHVPPLRERLEDVPLLARHFLARAAERFGVTNVREPEGFVEKLVRHDWPGNVRELENAVESLVAIAGDDGTIDMDRLPGPSVKASDQSASLKQRVDAYERGLLVAALAEAKGNRTDAAARLGISRSTLHEKLSKYGLG